MAKKHERRPRGDRVPPRWITSVRKMIQNRREESRTAATSSGLGLGTNAGPAGAAGGSGNTERTRGVWRWSSRRRHEERRPRAHGVHPVVSQAFAWSAHLYTAMGLVAAAAITVCIVQGDPASFRIAFALMGLATFIDATDGTYARRVRVKEFTPGFDGRRLDDLIDFLTYTCLPLFLLWRSDLLPDAWSWWLVAPLLASAYGFCQVSIKTDDGYFLGFPSYWNLVVFYLYLLQPTPGFTLGLLVFFAVMTFVPIRYLYPSQPGRLNRISTLLAIPWAILLGVILWRLSPDDLPSATGLVYLLTLISLIYPAYYFLASWVVTVKYWRKQRSHYLV